MHFNHLVSTSTITEVTVEGNTLANFYDRGRGIGALLSFHHHPSTQHEIDSISVTISRDVFVPVDMLT